MSDLQLTLLAVGALFIAAVFFYNWWRERRVQQQLRAAEREQAERADEERERLVPTRVIELEPVRAQKQAAAARSLQPLREFHPVADYVLTLEAEAPISGALLTDGWRPEAHRFAGHAAIIGVAADGTREHLASDQHYLSVQAGFQLLSRQGLASEPELLDFRTTIETLAKRTQMHCESPDMRAALDAARALDGVCADCDFQVALHVIPAADSTLPVNEVEALLLESGLTSTGVGYVLDADTEGLGVAVTAIDGRLERGVSFVMDVPKTPAAYRTWLRLEHTAAQIAARFAARVVDDEMADLNEAALRAISRQVEQAEQRLVGIDIPPGSALALRLFG